MKHLRPVSAQQWTIASMAETLGETVADAASLAIFDWLFMEQILIYPIGELFYSDRAATKSFFFQISSLSPSPKIQNISILFASFRKEK